MRWTFCLLHGLRLSQCICFEPLPHRPSLALVLACSFDVGRSSSTYRSSYTLLLVYHSLRPHRQSEYRASLATEPSPARIQPLHSIERMITAEIHAPKSVIILPKFNVSSASQDMPTYF
ncbi:uncharacterized protein SCHCODRAFT_02630352 [Schizophyllum commune H4-8]|uniref:uncharacterized protein n=1 Tax=Schizophyllum commune (strain H4-8 / FGSC 9210) TaxID=578458 RepID=UPI002160C2BF|nr:uncharacterized protein SCHCODRAFT_02630352 [Schizophyllum commune H4-8]KAI5889901.1 hypothetical protein SCHCODRAFT_02630352 [Schizophyllum commune H4-8]